jgi:hypothetical protein
MTSCEIVRAVCSQIGDRPALRAALLKRVDVINSQTVGQLLGPMARRGGMAGTLRLVSPKAERSARVWCVEALRG